MKHLLVFLLALLIPAAGLVAQAKKSYTFHGKVESIDAKAKSMTVDAENVEGWMGAMTMGFKIDNADAFMTVKVGDTIEATVYDGDYKLYKVHPVKADKKK